MTGEPIRFRRIYESLNSDLTKPFDPEQHARDCAATAARIEAERKRVEELKAAGVKPCPCCGEYHE